MRLTAITDELEKSNITRRIQFLQAPQCEKKYLYAAHAKEYVDAIFEIAPEEGEVWLDADTFMTPGSLQAALRASGANVLAIDALMQQQAAQVFCNVRPPGHHAEYNRAMGFCLFNNIAVGARYAQKKYQLERIAIIDFDVHHGNGTENIFRDDPGVYFCSLFQHPFYPYQGSETKSNHIINVPVTAGTSGAKYRRLFTEKIVPALEAFEPQLILVSAGFDAHVEDSLAGLCLNDSDYAWLALEIKELANKYCHGKINFTLEGGYALPALARSVVAMITELCQ